MLRLLARLAAAAVGPYPPQHEGPGKEPLLGGGTFAGTQYAARSALVRYEIGNSCCPAKKIGQLNVYVFDTPGVTCVRLDSARSRRFFSYTVETNGKAVPVGKRIPNTWFQQASFNVVGLTTGFQVDTSIVFTRADTAAHGLWHGRIFVQRQVYKGKTYSWAGTFAAAWCGTKTG